MRCLTSEAKHATGRTSGFKPKRAKTGVGELQLVGPQVRDAKFHPSALEKGCRSEKRFARWMSKDSSSYQNAGLWIAPSPGLHAIVTTADTRPIMVM